MKVETSIPALSTAEFGRLFASYRPRFKAIARRYVRSDAVAEDIVSDSFMSFWEAVGGERQLLGESNYPAYILTIVRNKCLDYLRAESRHAKIEQRIYDLQQRIIEADIRSLEAFDPRELFSEEVAQIVQRSLDALPSLTREVFVAQRFGGESYKQIALRYDITERRVEFEIEKARKQLRVALKDYLPMAAILLICNSMY